MYKKCFLEGALVTFVFMVAAIASALWYFAYTGSQTNETQQTNIPDRDPEQYANAYNFIWGPISLAEIQPSDEVLAASEIRTDVSSSTRTAYFALVADKNYVPAIQFGAASYSELFFSEESTETGFLRLVLHDFDLLLEVLTRDHKSPQQPVFDEEGTIIEIITDPLTFPPRHIVAIETAARVHALFDETYTPDTSIYTALYEEGVAAGAYTEADIVRAQKLVASYFDRAVLNQSFTQMLALYQNPPENPAVLESDL